MLYTHVEDSTDLGPHPVLELAKLLVAGHGDAATLAGNGLPLPDPDKL